MPRRPYPKILIMNRDEAEAFIAGPGDVCISIRSPGGLAPRLSKNYAAVLSLAFNDLGGFRRPYPENACEPTPKQVAMIAAFAVAHRNATRMVIHCEAGVSRSVTVALAISSKLSRSWAFPRWYRPEWRRTRFVRWREFFDAIVAAIETEVARAA